MAITPGLEIPLVLAGVSAATAARARRWDSVIKRMARISDISEGLAPPAGAVQLLVRGETVALPLKGIIDPGGCSVCGSRQSPPPLASIAAIAVFKLTYCGPASLHLLEPRQRLDDRRDREACQGPRQG
jgi:hypothetical protein